MSNDMFPIDTENDVPETPAATSIDPASIGAAAVKASSPEEAVQGLLQQNKLLNGEDSGALTDDDLMSAFEQVIQDEYTIEGGHYGIIRIVQPEIVDTIEARIKYSNKKREYEQRGVMSVLQTEKELADFGVWTEEHKQQERDLRNKVDGTRAIISQLNAKLATSGAANEDAATTIREDLEKQLKALDASVRELARLREPIDRANQDTSDSMADMFRWLWFATKCVVDNETGLPIWKSEEDILHAKDDADITDIVTKFMRTRIGPPLLRSELWQEETAKPAESGENSGE